MSSNRPGRLIGAGVAVGATFTGVVACGPAEGPTNDGNVAATTAAAEATETPSPRTLPGLSDPCGFGLVLNPDKTWSQTPEVKDPIACTLLMKGNLVVVDFGVKDAGPALAELVEDTLNDATEGRINPQVEIVPATDAAQEKLAKSLGGASCIGGTGSTNTEAAGILAVKDGMPDLYATADTTVVALLPQSNCDPSIGGTAFGRTSGGSEVYDGGLPDTETEAQATRRRAVLALKIAHETVHLFGSGHGGGISFADRQRLFPAARSVELGMLEGIGYGVYDGGYYDIMGNDTLSLADDIQDLDLQVSLPILARLDLPLEQAGMSEPMEEPLSVGAPIEFGVAEEKAFKFASAQLPKAITLTDSRFGPATFDEVAFVPNLFTGAFSVYLVNTKGNGAVQTAILGTLDKDTQELGIAGARFRFGRSGSDDGTKLTIEQIAL